MSDLHVEAENESLRKRLKLDRAIPALNHSEDTLPSSSPPRIAMGFISSPVVYPSSSPPPIQALNANIQRPLKSRSKTYGGFLVDDDEETENIPPLQDKSASPDGEILGLGPLKHDETALDMILKSAKPIIETDGPRDAGAEPAFSVSLDDEHSKIGDYQNSSNRTHSFGTVPIKTCNGKTFSCIYRKKTEHASYESIIAARSATAPGRAKASYYGIDIHKLLEEHATNKTRPCPETTEKAPEAANPSIEQPAPTNSRVKRTLLWTEKYRARKFTDLVGDERTHRQVLRWVKGWDPIVFPGSKKVKPAKNRGPEAFEEERPHRKILLLTGPPGLGKTTLAHVCARQAGYEVQEINASDERSSNVVKGRIRDSVGTENVRGVHTKTADGKVRKAGRPVCVVVDEVDGVVGGSGGSGEGGFVKALIDLILLDQKNSALQTSTSNSITTSRRKQKGDGFRLLRPLILICNDVYHPALRPLRQSGMAEIVHIRKPPISTVATRLTSIFSKEGYPCELDGVRRLCEAAWGISNRREQTGQSGGGEGDLRGVLVVAEWVASKLRAGITGSVQCAEKLTRKWVEQNILSDLTGEGGAARGLGRGGVREVVERVFKEGAGFPKSVVAIPDHELKLDGAKPVGVAEAGKRRAIMKLREMVEMCGDSDRIMADCFTTYPTNTFQDDTLLTKPCSAYDWLFFHDKVSSKVFSGQEWELTPYLSQSVLAFHHLFASSTSQSHSANQDGPRYNQDEADEDIHPFAGPRADFAAHEATKHNRSTLNNLQSSLSISLTQAFRSPEAIAVDLLPHLVKFLTPAVKPVVVGGSGEQRGIASVRRESEREMVRRAVGVMSGVGVTFERGKLDGENAFRNATWIYRMEPPLDALTTYETSSTGGTQQPGTRYAVRQVLDQEHAKHVLQLRAEACQARYRAGAPALRDDEDDGLLPPLPVTTPKKEPRATTARKRDFFGREIVSSSPLRPGVEVDADEAARKKRKKKGKAEENKVWVSFHEGFSNAVRKPITLHEIMMGL